MPPGGRVTAATGPPPSAPPPPTGRLSSPLSSGSPEKQEARPARIRTSGVERRRGLVVLLRVRCGEALDGWAGLLIDILPAGHGVGVLSNRQFQIGCFSSSARTRAAWECR